MKQIRLKRCLTYDGDLTSAIAKIKNNLSSSLLAGEPLICSYKENGHKKYLLALGIGNQDIKIIPAFTNPDELIELIKYYSTGLKIEDFSEDSDISVEKQNEKFVLKIKDSQPGSFVENIKTNISKLKTDVQGLRGEINTIVNDQYTIWFGETEDDPSVFRYPTSEWEGVYDEHVDDIYCTPSGRIWKFTRYNEYEYGWTEFSDKYSTAALTKAEGIQTNLDSLYNTTDAGIYFKKPIVDCEFSGLHAHPTIEVNVTNYEKYFDITDAVYLKNICYSKYLFVNLWQNLSMKLPTANNGTVKNTEDSIGKCRMLFGNNFVIYNTSDKYTLTISGYNYDPSTKDFSEQEVTCGPYQFIKCECKLDINKDGGEVIYWDIIIGTHGTN